MIDQPWNDSCPHCGDVHASWECPRATAHWADDDYTARRDDEYLEEVNLDALG